MASKAKPGGRSIQAAFDNVAAFPYPLARRRRTGSLIETPAAHQHRLGRRRRDLRIRQHPVPHPHIIHTSLQQQHIRARLQVTAHPHPAAGGPHTADTAAEPARTPFTYNRNCAAPSAPGSYKPTRCVHTPATGAGPPVADVTVAVSVSALVERRTHECEPAAYCNDNAVVREPPRPTTAEDTETFDSDTHAETVTGFAESTTEPPVVATPPAKATPPASRPAAQLVPDAGNDNGCPPPALLSAAVDPEPSLSSHCPDTGVGSSTTKKYCVGGLGLFAASNVHTIRKLSRCVVGVYASAPNIPNPVAGTDRFTSIVVEFTAYAYRTTPTSPFGPNVNVPVRPTPFPN